MYSSKQATTMYVEMQTTTFWTHMNTIIQAIDRKQITRQKIQILLAIIKLASYRVEAV
jgi:hypothetical protein